jgi:uncharacterized Zn finger protein
VFYLLAEAFDDDPFRILAWRGRDREELLAGLHAARGAHSPGQGGPARVPVTAGAPATVGAALADCLGSFFALPAPLPVTSPPAESGASILDQLPELHLAVRGRPLSELLHPAYAAFRVPRGSDDHAADGPAIP